MQLCEAFHSQSVCRLLCCCERFDKAGYYSEHAQFDESVRYWKHDTHMLTDDEPSTLPLSNTKLFLYSLDDVWEENYSR